MPDGGFSGGVSMTDKPWNTIDPNDLVAVVRQWAEYREVFGDIRRPKELRERLNELIAALVDDPLTPKLSKACRDALAKLRAEIESP